MATSAWPKMKHVVWHKIRNFRAAAHQPRVQASRAEEVLTACDMLAAYVEEKVTLDKVVVPPDVLTQFVVKSYLLNQNEQNLTAIIKTMTAYDFYAAVVHFRQSVNDAHTTPNTYNLNKKAST